MFPRIAIARARLLSPRHLVLYALFLSLGTTMTLASCALFPPQPGTYSVSDRLDDFPGRQSELKLYGPVEIRWNDYAVPYIIAEDERDIPYMMGVIHGHLRRSQMELFLRAARGELSRSGGPLANSVDKLLRTLDFDRAVPEMVEQMPDETRAWCQRYADGVNAQSAHFDGRPADARVAALDFQRKWTIADTLAIGRLASVDTSLIRRLQLLGVRNADGYDEYLEQNKELDQMGVPSFGPGQPAKLSELFQVSRSGSNSFAVSPQFTESGAAMLCNDPHLGFFLPNFWCLLGYKTPEHTVVGMTLAGVPAVTLGRNERIAWGGTNMLSYTSILYDVSDLPEDQITTRTERVSNRFWFDGDMEIRETPYGPLLSDVELLKSLNLPPTAFKWRGHFPSDEMTAFIKASHANNWDEYKEAWRTYSVAGMNMLYADVEGHIGQILAVEQIPAAAHAGRVLLAPYNDPLYQWGPGTMPPDLPIAFDPKQGYIVSANNIPILTDPPISAAWNANDRVLRMSEMIEELAPLNIERATTIQCDTVVQSAQRVQKALRQKLDTDSKEPILRAIFAWDGRYDPDSTGAVAFHTLMLAIYETHYRPRLSEKIYEAWINANNVFERVHLDVKSGEIEQATLEQAVTNAAQTYQAGKTWGEISRHVLQHPFGMLPVAGKGWRFSETGGYGGITSVRKAGGAPLTLKEHSPRFGSQSRHISDMSDLDANYFVLYGGQDGWIGSENMTDMIALFNEGKTIQMPLRLDTIKEQYARVVRYE